jgi:diadenosine tetraphosphate (Ap4A) HIT family hydrolase
MPCPICSWTPNDQKYLLLFETQYWRIVLAPNQCLIGRSLLHLKRHCSDLADLTPEETLDWLTLVKIFESAIRRGFDATLFNWACYMNSSFIQDPPMPHIHWWVVPRYNHLVHVDLWTFEDPHFGAPYDHKRWIEVPPELHHQIADRIKQEILKTSYP